MNQLRDDSGTSLVELMVVCVLMIVVLSTAYMLFGAATTMANESEARAIASDNAQHAVETMTRELRQAVENEEGYGALIVSQPRQMEFFMDANRDDRPEKVKYYVVGSTLLRAVAPAIGTMPPFTHGTYGAGTPVLEDLTSTTDPIFCYHSTTPNTATTCSNGEQHGFDALAPASPLTTAPRISMVGIDLQNQARSGSNTVEMHTSALVRIRAVENVVK